MQSRTYRYVYTDTAAQAEGVTVPTIRRMLARGDIRGFHAGPGRPWYVLTMGGRVVANETPEERTMSEADYIRHHNLIPERC